MKLDEARALTRLSAMRLVRYVDECKTLDEVRALGRRDRGRLGAVYQEQRRRVAGAEIVNDRLTQLAEVEAAGSSLPWHDLQRGDGMWLDALYDDVYHDLPIASYSRLEVLLRSPAEYHARFVAKTLDRDPTRAMRMGTLLHVAVLEPDRWERHYILEPAWQHDGRSKDGKAERAEWRLAADGRVVVRRDDGLLVLAMAEAIAADRHASALLQQLEGHRERGLVFRCRHTGVLVRARVDVALDLAVAADLKSIYDPRPDAFIRACVSKGYHRQNAIYVDGIEAVTGREVRFPFVVVHNKPPHEVAVYEVEPYAVGKGREQYQAALLELARREREDDWAASWQRGPQVVTFPAWAFWRTWDEGDDE